MEKLGDGDPRHIGAYRLLGRLGAGGMGHVYLARSDRGRTVAVKLVRAELAALEEFRRRFRQEVESARRVGGHWTAPVLDADTEAVVPWVATGYVAGPSLQQVVGHDHGALPERSVRTLAAGLAHALQDIHAAGIVHRDLKPSNVLVTIDGPRVIDFGIARALETVTDGGLTRTGALVGSPGFMAPEQVRGDRITPACDVFCLGSVLAYAATGRLPFGSANSGVHALMFRIAQEEPDLDAVPEGLADLVRDCLAKDPAARPGLGEVLERTGAQDTVADGRSRDPWLPGALVAQLGRHAVRLLDTENPEGPASPGAAGGTPGTVPGGPGAAGVPGASGAPGDTPVAPPGAGFPGAPRAVRNGHAAPGVSGGGGAPAAAGGPGVPASPAPQGAAPGVPDGVSSAPGAFGAFPGVSSGPGPASYGPGGTPAAPGPPPPAGPGVPSPAGPGVPLDHLPTMAAGHTPPPPPVDPAWSATPPGYHPYGGHGSTPPYGSTPPCGPPPGAAHPPPYGPPQGNPRHGRSTALLVVVALVVALGAGGSVYALMNGDRDDHRAGGDPSASPGGGAPRHPGTGAATTGPDPATGTPTTAPAAQDGAIPTGYLGSWSATIDNASGSHSRRLTIQQGGVGDTVLSLVADGPAGGGTYHCVFEAGLSTDPGTEGPLRIGASRVTVGRPASSCSPGEPTVVRLLPDGTLERTNTGTGERLTYTRG
ncbi:serine/threonine-protein kinase [Streptomyces sp. SCSIO 75703]|uniref:serine/threonine-protein kinase n=1 Tax=Streptomyces sp. SCSIO 75703 TaxID=3112165 RepID=UPI0030CD2A5E